MKNKLVLFGAGKIGRSFIGQLFARSGFEVVFVDIFAPVIDALNQRGSYTVVIKKPEGDEVIEVQNVRGVLASDRGKVAAELSDCTLAAVSVGQKGLVGVAPAIADGLVRRVELNGLLPLDIILAENMRDANIFVESLLKEHLPAGFPLREMVGLVETSIGKMVPIMPLAVQEADPLLVYAEAYNTLILDKKAFKNPIPEVAGLAPKENVKAWVDRKSYIHNFGHAAAAYAGYLADPCAVYMYQALEYKEVYAATRQAMLQSAEVLMKKYPGEFTPEALTDHIDDLLTRFRNQALGDTVYRVGCDLKRKLYRTDRVLSPLIDGLELGLPVDKIAQVFADGLKFRAVGENGQMFPDDADFAAKLQANGLDWTFENICGLDRKSDAKAIACLKNAIK